MPLVWPARCWSEKWTRRTAAIPFFCCCCVDWLDVCAIEEDVFVVCASSDCVGISSKWVWPHVNAISVRLSWFVSFVYIFWIGLSMTLTWIFAYTYILNIIYNMFVCIFREKKKSNYGGSLRIVELPNATEISVRDLSDAHLHWIKIMTWKCLAVNG